MNLVLETERLTLRFFTINDTPFIIELLNSPGWLAFIGDRNVKTEEDARNYLRNGPLKSYELNGFGLCLVELKNTKTPIGMCGILRRETLDYPDIGFAFLPAYTEKGYAFEVATATIQHAKTSWNIPKILGIVLPNNAPSIKLLEKIGLQFERKIWQQGEELLLYAG